MDEKTLRRSFYDAIKNYFVFVAGGDLPEKEITKGKRPDFIFYHKSDITRRYRFVIEAKKDGKKRGSGLGDWLKQASSYKVDQYTFVFTLPRFSDWYIAEGSKVSKHNLEIGDEINHCNIGSLVYSIYKIGQVVSYYHEGKKYIKFVLRDKCVWNSRTNVLNTKWLDIL